MDCGRVIAWDQDRPDHDPRRAPLELLFKRVLRRTISIGGLRLDMQRVEDWVGALARGSAPGKRVAE